MLGLGGALLVFLAAEGLGFVMMKPARWDSTRFRIDGEKYVESHPVLGFRPRNDCQVRARKTGSEGVIFDCAYTLDHFHRRVSPVAPGPDRARFALFLGCSFTFGEGVNDAETLPAQFAAAAPDFMPYNYGCGGWGPQNMYLQVQQPGFRAEIAQSSGVAIYTFIAHHVERAAGNLRLIGAWDKPLPDFTLENGVLTYHGFFDESRPLQHRLGKLLNQSYFLTWRKLDYPTHRRGQDLALVAALCAATAQRLEQMFAQVDFYVLLYPRTTEGDRLKPLLEKAGVRYLDYAPMFEPRRATGPDPYNLYDGHPTPLGYRLVAARLAKDLTPNPPPASIAENVAPDLTHTDKTTSSLPLQ